MSFQKSLHEFVHGVFELIMMNNKQVSFQVADALNQPFPDGKFDLVWSMESGEHMPDKLKVLIFLDISLKFL